VRRNEPKNTGQLFLLAIPFPATEGTPHKAQLVLATANYKKKIEVRSYASGSLQD
jgi:hypothetical protein